MRLESAADRAALLDIDSIPATYIVAGQNGVAIQFGQFDDPTQRDYSGPGLQAGLPTYLIRVEDLPTAARAGVNSGDRLIIEGVSWIPQGFDYETTRGFITIALRRTSEG